MKYHRLKLNDKYWGAKMFGLKSWEIRYNDKNFKEGDVIEYYPVDSLGNTILVGYRVYEEIIYIVDDSTYLQEGYICFSTRRLSEDEFRELRGKTDDNLYKQR